MPGQVVKYSTVTTGDRLHQGEILTNIVRARALVASIGTAQLKVEEITHPYLVVMTQDCDLEQDGAARDLLANIHKNPDLLSDADTKRRAETAPRLKIESVILCEAFPTSEMKNSLPPGKDIWKRIIQNKDERYHCVEELPSALDSAGLGFPSLGCDFKRFVTIPTDELYARLLLNQGSRHARLVTPYAEQLLHRFCNFQSRIPLPEMHEIPL